jgi:CDP-diacylglycerol---glycerol-3-phosphate 3-phosphatidyltransferase
MIDLACSTLLLAVAIVASAAYAVRVAFRGRATNARVEREGRSLLLGKGAMEMFHWVLEPLGAACAEIGLSANGVTLGSLGLAVGSGVALALGHMGMGAGLAALAAAGDGLDGAVARREKSASDAGDVLDAAVDRYGEFAFLGGLAFALRESAALLVLTLFALLASFMVSYSTAKASALQLPAPRGSMRRTERAVYLIFGTALSPFAALANPRWALFPIALSLALVAVVGNVSAVCRFVAVARGARARDAVGRSLPLPKSPSLPDLGAPAKLE